MTVSPKPRASTSRHRRARSPIPLCLAVFWAGAAHGAWEFVPTLSLEAEVDDNPRLLPESPQVDALLDDPASRLLLDARVLMTSYGTRGELFLEPTVRTDTYAGREHDDLQSTDVFLRAGADYRWERALAGFDANLSGERILGSEYLSTQAIDDPELDDLTVTDTVLLAQNERRKRILLSPFVEFEADANGIIRLDTRYMDVRYDGDSISRRTDFRDLELGSAYRHRLSERSMMTGRFVISTFRADTNQNVTNTAGIEARFSHLISETWSVDLSLGGVRSEIEYVEIVVDPTNGLVAAVPVVGTYDNPTFSVGLRRRQQLSYLVFDLQRNVSPDSFGFLVARNQLRLSVSQSFTTRLEGRLSLRAIETESINDELREDQSYGRLELGLDWAVGELWSLTAAYGYSTREVTSSSLESGTASSNVVSIGLNYRGRARDR